MLCTEIIKNSNRSDFQSVEETLPTLATIFNPPSIVAFNPGNGKDDGFILNLCRMVESFCQLYLFYKEIQNSVYLLFCMTPPPLNLFR